MITFELEEATAGMPCTPGLEEARALFVPGRRYTLREVMDAGLSRVNVLWLLTAVAERDRDAFARLRQWVLDLGGEPGATVRACFDAANASRVERVRALMREGMPRDEAKAKLWTEDMDLMIKAFS